MQYPHGMLPFRTTLGGFDPLHNWSFPAMARRTKADVYGLRPVTTGGIVIGYWAKLENGLFATCDVNRNEVFRMSTLDLAVTALATRNDARQAYVEAAREGAFGYLIQAWVRAVGATQLDEDEDVIINWPSQSNTDCLRAQVTTRDLHFRGWLVLTSSDLETFYVQDSATREIARGDLDSVLTALLHPETRNDVCHEMSGVQLGRECMAPLAADGRCPARHSHAEAMGRHDRDAALLRASEALESAMSGHLLMVASTAHNQGDQAVQAMIRGLMSSLENTRDVIEQLRLVE